MVDRRVPGNSDYEWFTCPAPGCSTARPGLYPPVCPDHGLRMIVGDPYQGRRERIRAQREADG